MRTSLRLIYIEDFYRNNVVSAESAMSSPTGAGGRDGYEQESSGASRSLWDKQYLLWLIEEENSENDSNVSFVSFVQWFGFMNLEDAKAAYEKLISSPRLRVERRRQLLAMHEVFMRNKLESFWPTHLLKMERRKTKTSLEIAVTKSARVVQTASVSEIADTAKLLENGADDQDESACALEPKRKLEVADIDTFKETTAAAEGDDGQTAPNGISSASVASRALATPSTANTTTVAGEEKMVFDPNAAEAIMLAIAGVEVGTAFRKLQREAALVVNDRNKKLTFERLPMFMACNYILHLDSELPGVDEDDMDKIRDSLHVSLMSVSNETALLHCALDEELAKNGWVRSKECEPEEESLRSLYQQLSLKLPRRFLAFRQQNEDTHAHSSLDLMMTMIFPSRFRSIELCWANKPSVGSKDRRGDPNKPDAMLLKDTFEVAFVEIKPPREERHERAFLEDQWALAIFAKDAIDYHLRHGRPFKTIPCVQVFGYQMILYKLEFKSGLYIWQQVGVSYLPRDTSDRGTVAGSLALLRTFKSIFNA
ncbi:hypothetical protein DFQ26_000358 [Actinomortierella ambigua]|nr:hypothetical protein DFQ26_000358 [Actinomortierella ambigua]